MIEITVRDGAVQIPLWAQPGAKKDRIVGEHNGCLKIAVTAPPEGGRANKAIVRLVADQLGIKRSAVQIVSGATTRQKRVTVCGVPIQRVRDFCNQFW